MGKYNSRLGGEYKLVMGDNIRVSLAGGIIPILTQT
jgi:hypothetical protein